MEIYDEGQGKYINVPSDHMPVTALRDRRPTPTAYPIEQHAAQPDTHLAALESLRETATPIGRALGLAIRTLPFAVTWLVLAAVLMVGMDSDWPLPFFLFALLTAGTYWALNQQEYTHSASGLERHKADLAHDLQSQKISNEHERATKLLDSYIRHLEAK